MRPAFAAAIGALLAVTAAGCALAPYGEETLPPIDRQELRITSGPGTGSEYAPAVEVFPGSTVQVLTEIADGKAVIVEIPRGPAIEVAVTARVEDEPDAEAATATIRSATGEPITMDHLYEFDPGYIGVEDNSDADTLVLRIATPRLTGTGQGQVPFTFKTDVE